MLGKVQAQTLNEVITTNVCNKLLENRCALCIRDSVEVGTNCIEIFHFRGNWVRSSQLIHAISPVLTERIELCPCLCVLR